MPLVSLLTPLIEIGVIGGQIDGARDPVPLAVE